MDQLYRGHGVQFRYPGFWELSEESSEGSVTVSVATGETAFWCVTLMSDRPPVDEVLRTTRQTYETEYPELDIYEVNESISAYETRGFDVEFVCLELLNTAVIRAFRTGRFTVLILFQGLDDELTEVRGGLEMISQSLVCEFGDDVVIG